MAFASGSSPIVLTVTFVLMVPPSDRKYAPIASAMYCDPPFGMGQPLRCPAMVSTKAMAEDVSASNGIILWATMPAHRPFAPRVRKRAEICFPDRSDEPPSELHSLMRISYD